MRGLIQIIEKQVDANLCIVDLMKRNSKIEILIGCTEEEKDVVD